MFFHLGLSPQILGMWDHVDITNIVRKVHCTCAQALRCHYTLPGLSPCTESSFLSELWLGCLKFMFHTLWIISFSSSEIRFCVLATLEDNQIVICTRARTHQYSCFAKVYTGKSLVKTLVTCLREKEIMFSVLAAGDLIASGNPGKHKLSFQHWFHQPDKSVPIMS